MAATPSNMTPLGAPAPSFTLPDTVSGRMVSLAELRSEHAVVVMFICNHCPFVIHVAAELAQLGKDYRDKLAIIAINSNDVSTHPDDAPDKMKLEAAQRGYAFPYLYDESQEVAKAHRAACTPDFFLFDKDHKLVYRGQLDDSRPNSDIPVTGADLRAAIDAVLAGKPVSDKQRPSAGCNIKWKAGNAPEYFG